MSFQKKKKNDDMKLDSFTLLNHAINSEKIEQISFTIVYLQDINKTKVILKK